MKLDFNELEKGFSSALEKEAIHVADFPIRRPGADNWAGIPDEKLSLPTRAGTTSLSPFGLIGITPQYLGKARELYEKPPTTDAPFLDYINKDKFDTYTNLTLPGKMTAPIRDTLNQGYNALGWVTGRAAPKAYNSVQNWLHDKGHGEASGAMEAGRNLVNLVQEARNDPNEPAPTTTEKLQQNQKAPITGVINKGISKVRALLSAAREGSLSEHIEKNYPQLTQFANSAKDTWNNMGTMGHVAAPLIGLGLSAILMHYFNRKKESRYPMGGGQPININIGGRPMHPMFENSGVGTFEKASHDNTKEANLVVDSLANAVRNRIANKVIDTAVAPEEEHKQQLQKEKELEITSKYPEMAKLLEDEKNKAYLERLLKE